MIRFKYLALIAFMFVGMAVDLNAVELSRQFSRSYNINPNSTIVRLDTRHGNVNIECWDSSCVAFKVDVRVSCASQSRAQARLDAFNVEFAHVGNEVSMVASLEPERLSRPSFGSFVINIVYTIKMPKNLDISVDHRYGELRFRELAGRVNFMLKYSDLFGERLTRGEHKYLNTIDMGYGEMRIDQVGWLSMDLKYSDVRINDAKALAINSKYSDIRVENVGSMAFDGKYDDYRVEYVDKIVGEGSYVHIEMGELMQHAEMDLKYGEVQIDYVSSDFSLLKCYGAYTDMEIEFDTRSCFEIDAQTSYADLSYENLDLRVRNRDKGSFSEKLKGVVGDGTPKAKVLLKSSYADINLKTR